jgi:hypothetical protein
MTDALPVRTPDRRDAPSHEPLDPALLARVLDTLKRLP